VPGWGEQAKIGESSKDEDAKDAKDTRKARRKALAEALEEENGGGEDARSRENHERDGSAIGVLGAGGSLGEGIAALSAALGWGWGG
jgi:hypothetical protein